MRQYIPVLVLLCAALCASTSEQGCEPLKAPQYGSADCSDGDLCLFSCKNFTELFGPSEATCFEGQWTNKAPICVVDEIKCAQMNITCTFKKKKMWKLVKKMAKQGYSSELLEATREMEEMFKGMSARSHRPPHCFPQLCGVNCAFSKYQRFRRFCYRCRNKNVCLKSGKFFGR